jgi:hypothetical protein
VKQKRDPASTLATQFFLRASEAQRIQGKPLLSLRSRGQRDGEASVESIASLPKIADRLLAAIYDAFGGKRFRREIGTDFGTGTSFGLRMHV